jgi:hypothetical protein
MQSFVSVVTGTTTSDRLGKLAQASRRSPPGPPMSALHGLADQAPIITRVSVTSLSALPQNLFMFVVCETPELLLVTANEVFLGIIY